MSAPRGRGRLVLLCALAYLGAVVACSVRLAPDDVPRQGWWDGDGIVVPHDSFPSDCSLCHLGGGWNELRDDFEFDHLAETGIPLEGQHARARCLRCHNDRGPVELFAARGCAGCHEDVHQGQLGTRCTDCHDEDAPDWVPRDEIDMHNRTRFPLVGAHAATACWACHPGGEVGNWSLVDVQCATCHLDDALATASPDHQALGWTSSCDRCHIPTSWTGAGFNHATFPLTGAHTVLDCSECHFGGGFRGIPTDCSGCHLPDYQGATDPDHVAGGFPTSCEQCHDTTSWEGAFFSHAGISSGCVSCHLADYQGATDPDHAGGGFSTSCEQCHGTTTWEGAFFSHAGITSGCVDCHLDEYQSTSAPNHGSAGFPTSCEACHQPAGWTPATFNHSFPIQSGAHGGFDCTECHLVPTNFASFSCTHCHDHNQSRMADKHDEEPGYQWVSSSCYSCHPTGTP
jgi:hypothetical protein